jgi:hypothetical protein
MNGYRLKAALTLLFLLIVVLLFGNIMYSTSQPTTISGEAIASTISVLKANGITITEESIPDKSISMKELQAQNSLPERDSLVKALLGENALKKDETYYADGDASLVFRGNTFSYVSQTPKFSSFFSGLSKSNLTKKATKFLDICGIPYEKKKIEKQGESYIITFYDEKNSFPIFDSNIKMVLSSEGLYSIQGSWVSIQETNGKPQKVKNITGVLVDFALSRPRPQKQSVIVDITLGYQLQNDTHLSPVWKITLDDKHTYYLDAT